MPYKTGPWGEQAKIRSAKRKRYFIYHTSQDYGVQRKAALEKLGNRCKQCGFSDIRALQIDHVNNDGAEEKRAKVAGITICRRILRDTENRYQLLCANCNWIKKYEHEKKKRGD